MQLRPCGDSDLKLSVLGMGCWAFGGGPYWGDQSQAEANAVVRAAVDAGITYFDTAEAYNDGRSEESLGEALRGVPREKVHIGTKISPSNTEPGALAAHCEASLRRLGTDYLDLYMVHWPITAHAIRHFTTEDLPTPSVSDAFATLMKLREQGKVRYLGVSNFGKALLEEARGTGAVITVNELPYNLLCRAIECEILPHCRSVGIGVIGYMALLQGILADIYPTLADVPVWQRRTRHFDCRNCQEVRHGEHGAERETAAALEAVRSIARELGVTVPHLALGWVAASESITCSLVGSRSVSELADNVRAVAEPLPAEIIRRLNDVTRPLMEKLGKSFDYYENPRNDRTGRLPC